MRHTFQAEQWLPFPVPVVFAFFANPQNLPPLMPKWQQARIEELRLVAPPPAPADGPSRLGTGVGTTMILSVRMLPRLPMRMNWHARIEEFEWNDHFCDVQTSGPFAYWRHCHRVKVEAREGVEGALLMDCVEYELPGGPLGDLADALLGKQQLRSIFAERKCKAAMLMPIWAERMERRRAE
ncbi:MAG TPA: SRPBCC family protein [Edaphobacter sp.]